MKKTPTKVVIFCIFADIAMKVVKYIGIVLLGLVVLFYVLPSVLVQIPSIQRGLAKGAATYFEERLGTEVEIGKVEYRLFNKLALREVSLKDQSGEEIFSANRIAAGIEIMPIFKNQFRVHSVQLYTFDIKLKQETKTSPLNIQYIIDAFASDSGDDSPVDLQITSVRLYSGKISYDVSNQPAVYDKLDPNHIGLSNITGRVKLNSWKDNSLDFELQRLGFIEKSGFTAKQISFAILANTEKASIKQLKVELPRSKLILSDITAEYEGLGSEFLNSLTLGLSITPSNIHLGDVAPIVPLLEELGDNVTLEGNLHGSLSDFALENVNIRSNSGLQLAGQLSIRNLNHSEPNRTYINAQINNSVLLPQYIRYFNLPVELERAGRIAFSGSAEGYINNVKTKFDLFSDIGNLNADLQLDLHEGIAARGNITSSEIQLNEVLNSPEIGSASFDIEADVSFRDAKDYSGSVTAHISAFEYQKRLYSDIDIKGNFKPNQYNGELIIGGKNGNLSAKGNVLLSGAKSHFQLALDARNIKLDQLSWMQARDIQNSVLSFRSEIDLTGNDIDNLEGQVRFDDFAFASEDKHLLVEYLIASIRHEEEKKSLSIRSDIFNAQMRGDYSFKSLPKQFEKTIYNYIPSLTDNRNLLSDLSDSNFSLYANIGDTQDLFSLLSLPFNVSEETQVSAQFDSKNNHLLAKISAPQLNIKSTTIDYFTLDLNNNDDALNLNLYGISSRKNYDLEIKADLAAGNDAIRSLFSWKSSKRERYEGTIDLTASFDSEASRLQINETNMIFNDSVWTLYPTNIIAGKDGIAIDGLWAKHDDQYINIEGNISHDPDDSMQINLRSVDLEYIFEALNIPALQFGGLATGTINAKDIYDKRELEADLNVKDFSFNRTLFGNLSLRGEWMEDQQGIGLYGKATKGDDSHVNIDGIINPFDEELSIYFDARNADLTFLRKYLNKVTKELSGEASGIIHLFGDLNNPSVEGDAYVKNGRFGIEYLNTFYHFTDKVKLEEKRISINNLTLIDDDGNTAQASGYVSHNQFEDFRYDVSLNFNNFQVLNTTENINPLFHGKAYGSGLARINGTEYQVNILANMENTDKTAMTFNFIEKQDIEEYNFITFVDRSQQANNQTEADKESNNKRSFIHPSETNLNLNMNMTVNPQASFEVVMSQDGKDKIVASGDGNVNIEYQTNQPFKIIGAFHIDEGEYNFSLEQLYYLDFNIERGSTVSFTGDPYRAKLDVKAAHTVQANIGDLDQQLLNYTTRSKVPVDCIINVKGELEHPEISFDIELPNTTPELERQVKSYIRTEDMLNRQILYLLVLNRFYTMPEFASGSGAGSSDYSFLTSTLSSQINNLLGSLSDKVQVGTQFHHTEGDMSSTEIELMLSSSFFNNRLIVYGNFGYVDNPYIQTAENNKIPIVGDFDVEYKLTPKGDIRLRGYNHYNYRYYYSSTPRATQGIGIIFRKDFNHLLDLFGKKRPAATPNDEAPTTE